MKFPEYIVTMFNEAENSQSQLCAEPAVVSDGLILSCVGVRAELKLLDMEHTAFSDINSAFIHSDLCRTDLSLTLLRYWLKKWLTFINLQYITLFPHGYHNVRLYLLFGNP